MTDWKSPAVITAEYFALIKLYHAIWGVLIWEFVVNLGFEYSVFTGKRKFRSSFLLYLAARWCPLLCVITILVGFDPVNQINCQAFVIFVFLFSHLSLACAEALIVLRIAAIWGLNKIAISIASAAWLADVGTLIHVLLALMLTGLLRWENARRKGGIWWLLFTQGLAWMIIVTVAEAPITVFILLNLNDPMNLMFQLPSLITMTIGASRVYRGLSDYVNKEGDPAQAEVPSHWGQAAPSHQCPTNASPTVPAPNATPAASHTSSRNNDKAATTTRRRFSDDGGSGCSDNNDGDGDDTTDDDGDTTDDDGETTGDDGDDTTDDGGDAAGNDDAVGLVVIF
ncbi:hypothetical protein EDB86DRAFT_3080610 [Lactarius hatsudake]|nr:hypothetical protein EDB86DRAFT_3080610 [Lactarius hatsudake]